MAKSLLRLLVIIAFGSFAIIQALLLGDVLQSGNAWSGSFAVDGILMVCLATIATAAFYYALKKLVPFIDASAQAQAKFLDTLNTKSADASTLFSAALGRKIYLMLQQAFDGRPPICVQALGSVVFLESNDSNWTLPPKLIEDVGFADKTAFYADPSLQAEVSLDDWPFFYMPKRVYSVSYLVMMFQVLILSLFVGANFLSEIPKFGHLPFFFLGAGFMLIETKGITEMGLTFGNTWQVIGIVIAGILTMAFLGNCAVQWLNIRHPLGPFLLLFAALAVGWYAARSGRFASTPFGRLETSIVLTLPLLFSGIVFSTLPSIRGQISGMIAMNLLGAVCGGLLEYNSMYFGFQFLYLVTMGCYILAFVSGLTLPKKDIEQLSSASTTIGHETAS
jgi:hypothetical protein